MELSSKFFFILIIFIWSIYAAVATENCPISFKPGGGMTLDSPCLKVDTTKINDTYIVSFLLFLTSKYMELADIWVGPEFISKSVVYWLFQYNACIFRWHILVCTAQSAVRPIGASIKLTPFQVSRKFLIQESLSLQLQRKWKTQSHLKKQTQNHTVPYRQARSHWLRRKFRQVLMKTHPTWK